MNYFLKPTKSIGLYHGNHGKDSFTRSSDKISIFFKNFKNNQTCKQTLPLKINKFGWTVISLIPKKELEFYYLSQVNFYFSNKINRLYDILPLNTQLLENLTETANDNQNMILIKLNIDKISNCFNEK